MFTVGVASAGQAQAGITGSKHDFKAKGWGTTEICVFCHTTHNSNITVVNAPLWNHAMTVATFQPYSSTTMQATPVPGQPTGLSKLCLSCHDGTVAIDSYGGRTGTNFVSGGTLVGTDLRNDHPIGFNYDPTLATADGGLKNPNTAVSGVTASGTINADLLANSNKMECSSCHDVHNTFNISKLLVKSNASSALCLTCHVK